MLLKVAKKDFNGEKVLKVGYCGLQSLLNHKNRFAYSSGVNGWACDYFMVDDVIISTGYSPIGKSMNYDVIKSYELKADQIRSNYSITYENRVILLDSLLHDLINEFKSGLK